MNNLNNDQMPVLPALLATVIFLTILLNFYCLLYLA
jgi:hypothetical protein